LPDDQPEAEARVRRDRLIHTIGNLTLINNKLNPAQSNKPWVTDDPAHPGKRDALQDHSVLFLNKEICKKDDWDENAINDRSESLFAIADTSWPRPT
jgi:hypothetical protein